MSIVNSLMLQNHLGSQILHSPPIPKSQSASLGQGVVFDVYKGSQMLLMKSKFGNQIF